ncbi:MAG: ComEC/Rec2 family competence protein, partial [Rickettsiales bacterium]|nr:ComEC/Rec2 family competence protein [Rickettsiales bacterium]
NASLFSVPKKPKGRGGKKGKSSAFGAFVETVGNISDRATKAIIDVAARNFAVVKAREATEWFLGFAGRVHNLYIRRFMRAISSANCILFFIILGFFAAKLRVNMLDTNLLPYKLRDARVRARVTEVEKAGGDWRLTFDKVHVDGHAAGLDKIRVKFAGKFGAPDVGRHVDFTATLIPPFEPNVIGGFDFSRYSYFKKLSASGRSFEKWEYAPIDAENTALERLYFGFLNMREGINRRVAEKTGKDAEGVLISMMTGDIYAVDEEIGGDYKAAGISHILSVSGLHMTIIAGFAFFLIRLLLSLSMRIASRYDTKKIAAVIALAASVFYLFLTGARIPTQRAFMMTALGLGAVLADRNPISLRFIAMSAAAILLFTPESLLNPGFQMSFMAVVALVKLYEAREAWLIPNKAEGARKWAVNAANALIANVLSAFLIGAAITPFVIYSFNTMQIYSVLGNLFALPLCTFVVMPAILLALVSMPFGLDVPFLKLAELGVAGINFAAAKIGSLPYASIDMKSMGVGALLLIVFGFVWLFAWRRKWKYFGCVLIAAGVAAYALGKTPDMYVDRYGTMFGLPKGGKLLVMNLSRYPANARVVEDWRRKSALASAEAVPAGRYKINGRRVSFVGRYAELRRECRAADMIFAAFDKEKAHFKCRKPVFGREAFRDSKGAEIYIPRRGRARHETVSGFLGRRPWTAGVPADKEGGSFLDAADELLKGLQIKK